MPISVQVIHEKLSTGQIDFSVHAVMEAAADLLFVDEIETALAACEIIEINDEHHRCVILADLAPGGYVHAVIEYADWMADPVSHLVVVTVYRPDPDLWIDGRVRRT